MLPNVPPEGKTLLADVRIRVLIKQYLYGLIFHHSASGRASPRRPSLKWRERVASILGARHGRERRAGLREAGGGARLPDPGGPRQDPPDPGRPPQDRRRPTAGRTPARETDPLPRAGPPRPAG